MLGSRNAGAAAVRPPQATGIEVPTARLRDGRTFWAVLALIALAVGALAVWAIVAYGGVEDVAPPAVAPVTQQDLHDSGIAEAVRDQTSGMAGAHDSGISRELREQSAMTGGQVSSQTLHDSGIAEAVRDNR
jgi:hypothetical protein